MLATAVIGLREGLEAALIVGIIAAFLRQNGRTDALRRMWFGVGAAVLICLAVGVLLQLIDQSLPQRQQEMLECVVAAIAVVMISYMVLWMRGHSAGLRTHLQAAAGGALAAGSATALVVMAFLAVFREGFETAVFLLAAFQSSLSATQAVLGAVLGIGVALVLGYLIYRGGIRLNLSRFFRITGVVLVLVAGGLVMSTLRGAYEAGWVTIGQQPAIRLGGLIRPGGLVESLLTGVLGIRSTIPVIELVAYLLFVVPMLLVVLWPPRRALSRPVLRSVQLSAAAVPLLAGVISLLLAPADPQGGRADGLAAAGTVTAGTDPATGLDRSGRQLTAMVSIAISGDHAEIDVAGPEVAASGSSELALAGHEALPGGQDTARYHGTALTAGPPGLPPVLTGRQVAQMFGGRLPVGLRGGAGDEFTATYSDALTPTVRIDPSSGLALGVDLDLVRTITLQAKGGNAVPAGRILAVRLELTPAAVAEQVTAVQSAHRRSDRHEILGRVLPALLAAFAVVVLAFALGRRRGPAPTPPSGASVPVVTTRSN